MSVGIGIGRMNGTLRGANVVRLAGGSRWDPIAAGAPPAPEAAPVLRPSPSRRHLATGAIDGEILPHLAGEGAGADSSSPPHLFATAG